MIRRVLVTGIEAGVFRLFFDVGIPAARTSLTTMMVQSCWPEAFVEPFDSDGELVIQLPEDCPYMVQVCDWVRDTLKVSHIYANHVRWAHNHARYG